MRTRRGLRILRSNNRVKLTVPLILRPLVPSRGIFMPEPLDGSLSGRTTMETLYYSRMHSPVGPLVIGVSEDALVALEFDRGLPETICGQTVSWRKSTEGTQKVREQLEQYFAGERREFNLKLDCEGRIFAGAAGRSCCEFLTAKPAPMPKSRAPLAAPTASVPWARRTTTIPSQLSYRAIACSPEVNTWEATVGGCR